MGSSNLDKAAKLLSDSSSNSSSIASTISSSINSNSSLLTSTASSLSQALSTTLSSIVNSTSVASSTRVPVNSTVAASVPVTVSTSFLPSSTSSPQPSLSRVSAPVPSVSSPIHDDGTNSSVALVSIVLFLVAVALVMKIVYSRRKKAQWINGTARWRMGNSQLSGGVPQTAANYSPMDRNGLDTPSQDSRIDWERQFFDESEQSSVYVPMNQRF